MSKVAFFYLNGTDGLMLRLFQQVLGTLTNTPPLGLLTVAGINGVTTTWQDGAARNDPFCNLLDPNIFEAKKLGYPALNVPMGLSINLGMSRMAAAITALPKGQKFAIGGYSQGAACAAGIELMLRPGGALASKASDYLGGVCFGSPRRQTNYRGEVGGTWSGAWDVENSTTGGHGAFPATGNFARLTNCDPTKWIEFTDYGDVFSSTGDSQLGLNWSESTGAFLNLLDIPAVLNALVNLLDDAVEAMTFAGFVNTFTDAVGKTFPVGGHGHTAYPWRPPPGDPDNGLTAYQIGIKWLTSRATASAVAPILLPQSPISASTAGWTTTLIPPA